MHATPKLAGVGWLAPLGVALASSLSCGTEDRQGNADAGTAGSSGGFEAADSGGSSGATSNSGGSPPVSTCSGVPVGSGLPDGEECTGASVEAQPVPVDMYLIIDRSSSMVDRVTESGQTRWAAVTEAVRQFVQSPDAAGSGAGVQFFPASRFGDDDSIDCDASQYATPNVAIGPLPDVGDDIVTAVEGAAPNGFTPTSAALSGAIDYAKTWATDHPDRATVVVLVTDGYPTQCTDNVDEIAEIARAARETEPRVSTFVVGIGGEWNLAAIAQGGGTIAPYIVSDATVTDSFLEALHNIAATPLSCDFELPEPPPGQELDLDLVQVVYEPAEGDAEEIPRAHSSSDCLVSEHGGWYYTPVDEPERIRVCDCNCRRFGAGRLTATIGCAPAEIH